MSETCKTCSAAGQSASEGLPVDEYIYHTGMKSIEVVLIKSVTRYGCPECGEDFSVPDLNGLNIAIAVTRVKLSVKLSGDEIRFIRKTMQLSAKDTATFLDVSPETVSRWENDKLPMTTANEKIFRLMAYFALSDQAIGVELNPEEITKLRIPAIRSPEKLVMGFERVRVKTDNRHMEEVYVEIKEAA